MKKIVTIIIVIAVIVGAFFFFRSGDKKVTTYETVELKKGSINNTVTATGTIEPITKVDVGTQVSGTISHIYVDYNSVVTKGQLLAELDRKLLEAELKSEMANLKSSKSEFEYQDKNFKRLRQLHEKNLISETEYEEALYQYEKAQQAYEKAQATMVKAQSNLDYATITSPIDGVVLSREVEEGQTVAASFETPTMFTIANDLRKMQVIADVDEADIGQVLEGQRVTFTVDAFPDDTFEGDVTQVRLNPTTESNVVTYEVVIDAPNPELKLKPGLTANITVYTMEKDNILLAPLKAFRFICPSGATILFITLPSARLIGASTVPSRSTSPHTIHIYFRFNSFFCISSPNLACMYEFFATAISPEVSLSRRFTARKTLSSPLLL